VAVVAQALGPVTAQASVVLAPAVPAPGRLVRAAVEEEAVAAAERRSD
jgi:hypothetical protein